MTNTNNDILANVSTSINAFMALPVYSLLSDVPNDLSLKLFIPSKDNSSVLAGTQELWRQIDVSQFDFALPSKAIKPDKPVKPEPFTGKAKQAYYDDLEIWSDWETTDEALLNVEIDRVNNRLIQHDIVRKHQRLSRVCQFVSNHDASMFEHDEELDLFDLPETTRNKILQVYKNAFKASPKLLLTGSSVDLLAIDPLCSLDSIDGIDRIITIKNTYPSASYAFMGSDVLTQAFKVVKNEINAPTAIKMLKRLDCHLGGSKNSTTILASIRMLYGLKPLKGKQAK